MRSRLYLLPVLLFAVLMNAGCGDTDGAPEARDKVMVATAANVQYAMADLAAAFQAETGLEVEVVISSSGKLATQIRQGAPYDLFVSADMRYPRALFDGGYAVAAPRPYAYGVLVIWTLRELDIQSDLSFLQDAAVAKIAVANPRNAPYGEEALKVLRYYGIYDGVADKLVYGESIAQTNQYIISRAADVGFTAKAVVLSPQVQGQGRWLEVDPAAYEPIEQGVVVTRHGRERNPEASRRFYEFLFSETARGIFERFGYRLPGPPSGIPAHEH